jgi:hypothetical protein
MFGSITLTLARSRVGRLPTYQSSLVFLGLLLRLLVQFDRLLVLDAFLFVFSVELLVHGNEPVNSVVPIPVGMSPLCHSVTELLETVFKLLFIFIIHNRGSQIDAEYD